MLNKDWNFPQEWNVEGLINILPKLKIPSLKLFQQNIAQRDNSFPFPSWKGMHICQKWNFLYTDVIGYVEDVSEVTAVTNPATNSTSFNRIIQLTSTSTDSVSKKRNNLCISADIILSFFSFRLTSLSIRQILLESGGQETVPSALDPRSCPTCKSIQTTTPPQRLQYRFSSIPVDRKQS